MQELVLSKRRTLRLSRSRFVLTRVDADHRRQREADALVDEAEGSSQLPLSSDGLQLTRVSQADAPDTAQNVNNQVPNVFV
jgi:hypothetical protein